MARSKEKGKKGEERASLYLKKKGYDIIERNFRSSLGEIDIIALERATETLVFVEVKYRSSLAFGHPLESITPKKAERIRKVASLYVQKTCLNYKSFRFDVIAILGNKLYHLVNAF